MAIILSFIPSREIRLRHPFPQMTQLEDQISASSPLKGPLKVLILDKLPQSAIDHFTNKNYQVYAI